MVLLSQERSADDRDQDGGRIRKGVRATLSRKEAAFAAPQRTPLQHRTTQVSAKSDILKQFVSITNYYWSSFDKSSMVLVLVELCGGMELIGQISEHKVNTVIRRTTPLEYMMKSLL